jgi:hypothetical protein
VNKKNIKKYKVLVFFVLVVIWGVFFLFYRMYHDDVHALENFVASYKKFDRAISDFSISQTDDLESRASEALTELISKATLRLSSLIKNDAELMDRVPEVADLSGKELESLRAYKRVIQSKIADAGRLAPECGELTNERKAAYARFQELAGLKD